MSRGAQCCREAKSGAPAYRRHPALTYPSNAILKRYSRYRLGHERGRQSALALAYSACRHTARKARSCGLSAPASNHLCHGRGEIQPRGAGLNAATLNVVEGHEGWRTEDKGEAEKKWRSEHGACRDRREPCRSRHPAHSGRGVLSLGRGRGERGGLGCW